MSDKLYTQKEVDDIQRLAQAAALKEAADALTRKHHADFSIGVARAREIVLNCALSDQPLLAQHDAELEMKAHDAGFQVGFEGAERAAFEREREYVTRLHAETVVVIEKVFKEHCFREHKQAMVGGYCTCGMFGQTRGQSHDSWINHVLEQYRKGVV